MSYPSDPGGAFTTGPSTSPVLSEPAIVGTNGAATGPAPQTGPLQAYVDASARTDSEKQALLSSIATLGSVGKQAYVQQQTQNNQARLSAIRGINAATGMAGTPSDVQNAISSAFAGQQNSTTQQQASLDNYNTNLANAANSYYGRVQTAIPIMEERTKQQVNNFYAAQRLEAQRAAITAAQDRDLKQAQIEVARANAQASLFRSNTAESNADRATTNLSIAETNLQKAGLTLSGAQAKAVQNADKIIGPGLAQTPDMGPGTFGYQVLMAAIADAGAGPAAFGKASSAINNIFTAKNPDQRLKGLSQASLLAWLSSYYQGSAQPEMSQAQAASLLGGQNILAGAKSDTGVVRG